METIINTSSIETKVKAIFVDTLGVDEHALTRDASFSDDLGLDSLDVLETFTTLEKQFGIKITDEAAEKLTTVGSVIDYIIQHKN